LTYKKTLEIQTDTYYELSDAFVAEALKDILAFDASYFDDDQELLRLKAAAYELMSWFMPFGEPEEFLKDKL
jgi:hypothetical protein